MIDIDEYIEMWDDNLLGSEGVQILMNTLIAEVKRLRERLIRAYDWAERVVNGNDSAMMDYTEYVCGGEEE